MTLNITLGVIAQVCDISKRAGREIMEIYKTDFDVEIKADSSPVTQADQIAEALIIKAIKEEITATFPIVGEEDFAAGNAPDVAGKPFWLVDALDGTKQFVNRRDEFTVNIALIENGQPVLGVVHIPAYEATYWGSRYGAFAETDKAQPAPISCRRPPQDGLVALVSRSHRTPEVDDFLAPYSVKKEISAGSSLKFCYVAAGRADIYPRMGRTMEWDTAAGHGVLMAAGGCVLTLDGEELRYGKDGFENPHFVAKSCHVEAPKT